MTSATSRSQLRSMRARLLASVGLLAAAALMTGGLSACSSSDADRPAESSAAGSVAPNLTGVWDESEPAFGIAHQAVITGSTITIYWLQDGGNALYWAGSFEAPTAPGTYTWKSTNDTSRTANELLASSDDTKDFTYKDGVITYQASAAGQTSTITLKRTSTTLPAGSSAAASPASAGHAEVVESGMGVDGGYAWVSAMVRHDGLTGEFATVLFNIFDSDDVLIASQEQVEQFTTAGTTFPIGTQVTIPDGTSAARVEATVSVSDFGSHAEPMPVLAPIKVSASNPRFRISNETGDDWKEPRIAIVCRDAAGAIVGGGVDFPNMIPAGGQFLVSDAHLIISKSATACSAYVQLELPK